MLFRSLGQQGVAHEGNLLRQLIAEADRSARSEDAQRMATATEAAGTARAQATRDAATTKANADLTRTQSQNPLAPLVIATSKRLNMRGEPASPEELAAQQAMIQALNSNGSSVIIQR